MRFDNRVVMVTGGSKGIGEATVLAFAREGANVAIVDIDEDAAAIVADEVRSLNNSAEVYKTDVSLEKSVKETIAAIFDKWGRLDILVNNAGIYYQGDVLNTSLEVWENILSVNLTGAFLCTKYAVEGMRKQGSGVVINVASEAGLVGIKGQVAYNVSKGAMISLTRSCAVDHASDGIRVNCVCPGTTETPLVREAVNRAEDPKKARRNLEIVRPQNRLGKPKEIASAILYLASDEAGYATGAILSMDGGFTAQ